MHVKLVIGVADDFAVPCQRSPDTLCFSADGETLDQLSVDTHIELLWRTHANDVVVSLPPKPHLEDVLAIERERMADGQTAA